MIEQKLRGYGVLYRRGEVNHCPGCGGSCWWLGRLGAECGGCGTALDYAEVGGRGIGSIAKRKGAHAWE